MMKNTQGLMKKCFRKIQLLDGYEYELSEVYRHISQMRTRIFIFHLLLNSDKYTIFGDFIDVIEEIRLQKFGRTTYIDNQHMNIDFINERFFKQIDICLKEGITQEYFKSLFSNMVKVDCSGDFYFSRNFTIHFWDKVDEEKGKFKGKFYRQKGEYHLNLKGPLSMKRFGTDSSTSEVQLFYNEMLVDQDFKFEDEIANPVPKEEKSEVSDRVKITWNERADFYS